MNNTIIISSHHGLFVASNLHSINNINSVNNNYKIGDIYFGKVDRLLPSINSAFIKLKPFRRYSSTGFIYIKDLKCIKRIRPLKNDFKIHPIYQLIVPKQKIVTQVVKEIHFEKGPRLTTVIVLSGYYIKLLPFSNIIHVSNKVQDVSLRNALKAVGKLIITDGMGIIFRLSAIGVSTKILLDEFYLLKDQWFYISKQLIKAENPILIHREDNIVNNSIRNYYSFNTRQIFLDSADRFSELKFFLNHWNCLQSTYKSSYNKNQIHLHKKDNDFWYSTNLDVVVNNLFKNIIHLPYGGYLFLETINAMTVIDVNSGGFNSNDRLRDSLLKVNLAAAKEIVYQIIIRNIAGIILIDFIDMKVESDKELLLEYLFNLLQNDNNQSSIVQYSQLGIVEITRKRASRSFSSSRIQNYDLKIKFSDTNTLYAKKIIFENIQCSKLYV